MRIGSIRTLCRLTLAAAMSFTPTTSFADAGGIGFWLPGQMGSLAAAPSVPGWSLGLVYYHASVQGGGEVAASRQAEIGRFHPNINVSLSATLDGRSDLFLFAPAYTFATPVFGAQLTVGLATIAGHSRASIDGTLTASIGNL